MWQQWRQNQQSFIAAATPTGGPATAASQQVATAVRGSLIIDGSFYD
jgi:hypothetical protein